MTHAYPFHHHLLQYLDIFTQTQHKSLRLKIPPNLNRLQYHHLQPFLPLLNQLLVWFRSSNFTLSFIKRDTLSWDPVNIFQMTTKVTTLGKSLSTLRTSKWSLACMLPKMIAKVTTFLKNWTTTTMSTLKIKLYAHSFRISDLDSLMPITWYAFKSFWLWSELGRLTWSPFSSAAFFDLMSNKFRFFF